MEDKQLFKGYYARLRNEGIVKAVVCGLSVGFAIAIIPAFIAYMVNNFNLSSYAGLLISLCVGVLCSAVASYLFYNRLFRPSIDKIAAKVDRLGLEERLITMRMLENDQSYLAMRQREDAKEKLRSVSSKQLRLSIFVIPIVVLAVIAICSTIMSTFSVAGFADKIKGRVEAERPERAIVEETRPEDGIYNYYTIEYIVIGGGYIDGDTFQVVVEGEDSDKVVARPFEDYAFVDWIVDADKNPEKLEENVGGLIFNAAQFQPSGDGEGDGEGDSDQQQEQPQPDPDSTDGEFDPNVVIDGTIIYKDESVLPVYLAEAMEKLNQGEEIPSDLRKLIELYFSAIQA